MFFRDEDYRTYLDLLCEFTPRYGVSIGAYCLMPNHVHIVGVPEHRLSFAQAMQRVHSEYARLLHDRLERSGHLWQARYYSVALDESHFWAAMVYVEQNPARAGLVEHPTEWAWSSARAHAGGSNGGMLDLEKWRESYTPERWSLRLELGLRDAALAERIREATVTGRPLGDEDFLERLQANCEAKVRGGKAGRPRKKIGV